MGNKATLADCIRIAEFGHFHQTDKAGEPYIRHPMRVLRAVQDQGAQPYVQMAAVLHDVTEDTPWTLDMLRAFGVPEAAVEIVRLLDRNLSKVSYVRDKFTLKDTEDYLPYIPAVSKEELDSFYYTEIRMNHGARMCKLSDIGDNMLDWRRNYLPEKDQERLEIKYTKAVQMLNPRPVDPDGPLIDYDPYKVRP